jgi:UDP-N-acetylglucosamine transferase subunit ALG13
MSTFVTVGNANQPFRRLLDMVCTHRKLLPKPIIVQAGNNDFECNDCKVVDFMTMEEFEDSVASAELVIMHAGAGSVLTALRKGKHPVVMARTRQYGEHVNDHQSEFVAQLLAAGLPVNPVSAPEEFADAVAAATDEERYSGDSKHERRLLDLVSDELAGLAGKGS